MIATIGIVSVVGLLLFVAVRKLYKDSKAGKRGCGCTSCSECAANKKNNESESDACHAGHR